MTRISACDGRYVSLAQQRRAWEELNRIFGGQTPTPPPPGPTPPGPDPPDPPGPDPDPPTPAYECVCFYVDHENWRQPDLEPYIVTVMFNNVERFGLVLLKNVSVYFFSLPVAGFRTVVGLNVYRNGERIYSHVDDVWTVDAMEYFSEHVIYDSEKRMVRYFCDFGRYGSKEISTVPLEEDEDVVVVPAAFSETIGSHRFRIGYCGWQVVPG